MTNILELQNLDFSKLPNGKIEEIQDLLRNAKHCLDSVTEERCEARARRERAKRSYLENSKFLQIHSIVNMDIAEKHNHYDNKLTAIKHDRQNRRKTRNVKSFGVKHSKIINSRTYIGVPNNDNALLEFKQKFGYGCPQPQQKPLSELTKKERNILLSEFKMYKQQLTKLNNLKGQGK
jgi:hypothetical protein